MTRYAGDPYWTTGKYGSCCKCGCSVKGKRIFYYPKGKHVYCETCGVPESKSFNEAAFDEDVYNYQRPYSMSY